MFEKKNILGVGITSALKQDILEYIIRGLANGGKKWWIATVNPEILMLANKDETYKKVLNSADLALPDGIGVVLAGKILGKSIAGRATGIDLLEKVCKGVAEKPITVGFLGGKGGVAEKTAECLREKYPGLRVGFVGEEWPGNNAVGRRSNVEGGNLKIEDGKSINPQPSTVKIPSSIVYNLPSSIDILFVAFGAPKQEMWIAENLQKIPVKVAMGVGGAFDFISGKVPRAPLLIRLIGFEWLFRLIVQPWRWKRQLSLLKFIWLVLKERFR